MTQKQGYRISTIVFSEGERLAVLLSEAGVPEWMPTLYATSQLRNANLAPSTTKAALDAIKLLLTWAESKSIYIEQRFMRREFLTNFEIEDLALRLKGRSSRSSAVDKVVPISRHKSRVRAAPGAAKKQVDTQTAYNRITAVAAYLDWKAKYLAEREAKSIDQATATAIELMGERLRSKRGRKRKSELTARKGLDDSQQQLLETLVNAGAESNPFHGAVRVRNELIFRLLDLGIRAGELLSLKVSDFDFQANTVSVARRHGDNSDPRRDQPVVKTRDRLLPIASELAAQLTGYIMKERRSLAAARRHSFLLVTHRIGPHLGQPMTYKALAKLVGKIRDAARGSLEGLSCHVLRHTANDRFSELMDVNGTSSANEEKMRSYVMGWREGSGSAATYTKRHTQRQAMEAALSLQKKRHKEKAS